MTASGALGELRVLDLSRVLAGPYLTMMLADQGADVIKVEPLSGDESRTWGPPFVDGESTYFMGVNRNKRSMALDLSTATGQDVIRRLATRSDVVVENFKSGTMERWGLGFDALRTLQPRLIHIGISGFGRHGPYANVAGYDAAVLAMGGLMSVTGEPDGDPIKVGIALADIAAANFAFQALLLALLERDRNGRGQSVEISLLESVLAILHPYASAFLNAGAVGVRSGNRHPVIAPYELVPTADRPIYLACGNDAQVRRLSVLIGRGELADDPRFRTNRDRVHNRAALLAIIGEEFRKRSAAEWQRALWEADIPGGPVNSVDEVFADPQVQHLRVVMESHHPGLSSQVFRSVRSPLQLANTPTEMRRHPPRLGEHTREILSQAGYSETQVDEMIAQGVARVLAGSDTL